MLLFFQALLIGFIGSLQPGPVNLSASHRYLKTNFRAAILLAFGGVIPQMIYAFIVFRFVKIEFFSDTQLFVFQTIGFLFLLGFGISLILRAHILSKTNRKAIKGSRTLLSGFLLAIFNLQLPVFWFICKVAFFNNSTNEYLEALIFGIAGGLGAFLAILVYLLSVSQTKERLLEKAKSALFYKLLGVFYCIFAIAVIIIK